MTQLAKQAAHNRTAIIRLAEFMIDSGKNVISCEETMAVLDASHNDPAGLQP